MYVDATQALTEIKNNIDSLITFSWPVNEVFTSKILPTYICSDIAFISSSRNLSQLSDEMAKKKKSRF